MRPTPEREWPHALAEAQQAADSGRYAEAEHVLTSFASSHAGTAEAAESAYWRALYKLDPANKESNATQGMQALDAYLALGDTMPHHDEVRILRRAATLMQSLYAEANAPRPAPATQAADKAKEEELQKLRDDLAAAQAELERIKKRVTAPKP